MAGRRGGSDPFFDFGDPFAGFGGFGSFGGHRSLLSSVFGGRDPFDDPFFTSPFGGMNTPGFFGLSGSPFAPMHAPAFIEHQPPFIEHQPAEPKRSRGPIIEELDSDDEKEEANKEKKENPRKHGRTSSEPFVEDPDDEVQAAERRNKHLQHRNDYNRFGDTHRHPQGSFTFQSSTVTYGGANGAYYTSSTARRTGSDGVTIEESKEADTTAGQATHRISRGLHNKGHTVTRKLNSDGRVDTMQTLHNLNEAELTGFEEAWNGSARKHLPGWHGGLHRHDDIGAAGSSGQSGQASRGGWALPSTEHPQHSGRMMPDSRDRAGSSMLQSGRMKGSANGRGRRV